MIIDQIREKGKWNEFVASSQFGDILQTWEWGEVKKSELWEPYRVQVRESGVVLGQALILSRMLPLGFRLFYMPRGPVLDYASANAPEILRLIVDWSRELAESQRGLMVKMGPAVSELETPGAEKMLKELGMVPSFRSVQMRYTRIVDLRPSDADILGSFDKDTRNLVRRAAKEGVLVDHYGQVEEMKALRTFHNMYLSTSERGHFPARSWGQMVKLWELMAPLGMAHVYTASFENEPMASSLVLRSGTTAYQLWSGSRRDVGKKFPTYALQWTIMQDMKQRGADFYDMWGVAPNDEDKQHPWAGPTLFKKGFNGRRVEFVGDYDLPVSPAYPLFILAEQARQRLAR